MDKHVFGDHPVIANPVCQFLNDFFITYQVSALEEFIRSLNEAILFIKNKNLVIIQSFIYGSVEYIDFFHAQFLANQLGKPPYTWIGNGTPDKMYGFHLHAIINENIRPIQGNQSTLGYVYDDQYIQYGYIHGILPESGTLSVEDQTSSVFSQTLPILAMTGMKMTDVVRTWFYNKDILSWYHTFNEIRTKFYREQGVYSNRLPASTGIDGINKLDKHLILSLLSVKSIHENVVVKEVVSPLQGPASEYGSSFSRAIEIITPAYHKVLISGTASIDKNGKTIHLDDFTNQIKYTLATVEEILISVHMTFSDATRVIAYCKTTEGVTDFKKYLRDHPIFKIPVIITQQIICRDNLLFEIEMDAITLPATS